jgi:PAP2 superfamily
MLAHRMRRVGLSLAASALLALAASAPARADAVTEWNQHATNALIVTGMQTPPVSTIHLGIVHGAVYDAVNSIDGRYEPYLVKVRARRWYSKDAAAATAAYRVLAGLLPAQQATLGPLYAVSLAGIPPGSAKDGGILVGEIAAAAMLAARANDGRFPANPFRFPAPATPKDPWPVGQWRPTPTGFVNDPFAWVKDVKPFLVVDPADFLSDGPNALTSRKYAREFNEVKLLGSATSSARTLDQTAMARFWAEGPVIFTRITRQLSDAHHLDIADNARLFAMLYLTAADSVISCWQDKAKWLFWRPVTAIHEADRDGNPATEADRNWMPLSNTPPYPDHASGLSCVGSAMGRTLRDFFGTNRVEFSATTPNSTTTRSFTSFSQAVDEIVDARVYSGIHFRIADVHGALIGKQVARYGQKHYFHPKHGFDWKHDSDWKHGSDWES